MSEFGIKIKNIEAATLYEYNKGLREHYDYKDAMFVNSLFKDFMCDNGLKVWNGEFTRDLICLEFNFGTRSYEDEIKHIKKIAKKARLEYKKAASSKSKKLMDIQFNKKNKIMQLYRFANKHKDEYFQLSADNIREEFYKNGVDVEYITRKRSGEIIKKEVIHYKMLYRSTGKAKKGSCMFIRDKLYNKASSFLRMGIKLPKKNADIVGINAYSPLISSGIVGKVKINPKNILVLKDVDRFFTTKVVSVETDKNKRCIAKTIENYKLKNTLFDGQALIDSSIFPDWGNGYVLLRHHFCKMAAFCSNIQLFFRDYFGEEYYTATVEDMWGNKHYVKDIELITTDNAMKWIKYNVSYDYWCNKVYENGCMFGIVKTAHCSKLGNVQRMSYQMVNSLNINTMNEVCKESIKYINKLKTDDDFFLDYLRKNINFSNDYEVLMALCNQNKDFLRSSYFRERKKAIIMNYVLNFKSGKIIQNADNLVIVGSPYAMLLYGATGNPDIVDEDDTFSVEDLAIQCYTSRFADDEYLAEFRSPFNGKYNLGYLHNIYDERFNKYFNFCDQIIAINMNGTDFQDRNNGSDQDSDSIYTTNQPQIVDHAKKCQMLYPTIVNNIPKDSNIYNNTMEDFAKLDNKLAASQLDIGESSNLAQLAQTYDCTFGDQKYKDYVCILSVLAQIAIDSAKRLFDVDVSSEIRQIKKDMNVKENKYPSFWKIIHRDFKDKNINHDLLCPMNYLYNLKLDQFRSNQSTIPVEYFFKKFKLEKNRKTCKKVEDIIETYINKSSSNFCSDNEDAYFLLKMDFDNMINDITRIYVSGNYIGLFSWLIDRAFCLSIAQKQNQYKLKSTIKKRRSILIKALYSINSANLLKCFSNNC
nr:MAG TPA: RNA-dependent RNA polymerase [Bacteriophage sp.]